MDKISVIVPIYNGGKLLERCLNSIINQSYQNLEIILINDGSTDDSFSICLSFAQSDSRIKLINQINLGRNRARNRGMEEATGEFIAFIDQDDFINIDYFKHLYQQSIEFNSDIAICDYKVLKPEKPGSIFFSNSDKSAVGGHDINDWLTKLGKYYITIEIPVIVPWAKIIRRSCAKNVAFPYDRSLAEDLKTMWKFYLNARRISFQDQHDYINQQHPNTLQTTIGMAYESVIAFEEIISFLSSLGINTQTYYEPYQRYLKGTQYNAKVIGNTDLYNKVTFKLQQLEHFK